MPSFLGTLGMQAAEQATGGLVGEGLGLLFQPMKNKQQLKQAGKLQELQIKGNKELTDYNTAKQLQFWKDTSYGPQVELMKEAGINPALMYGMSGGGGQSSTIQTGNVSGNQAAVGHAAQTGMGLQIPLIQAQVENIKADTKKKEAETAKTAGVDTELGKTQIQSLTQGIENAKAQKELTEIQTEIAEVENDIKGATQNAAKALIFTQLRQATEVLQILANDKDISEATKDEKIKIIEQELIGSYVRNELTRAQTGQTKEQTDQLAKTIALEYARLANQKDATAIQKQLADFETSFGGQAAGILGSLLSIIPGNKKSRR